MSENDIMNNLTVVINAAKKTVCCIFIISTLKINEKDLLPLGSDYVAGVPFF